MKLRRRGLQPLSYCIMPSHLEGRDIPSWAMDDAALKQSIDTRTLFYDVFLGEQPNTVVAVGPPLKRQMRNFIKEATLTLDDEPATMTEVSQTRRSSTLEITSAALNPSQLVVVHPSLSFIQAVGASLLDDYTDKRALFTLSQDNDLNWIRDWARFHVETQGVNAIVFFDNASSCYGANRILEVFSDISGLQVFDVVSLPFQYGARGNSREHLRHRFLQFSVLEIARRRFLGRAKGVLNMDIDELAYGPDKETVFDRLALQDKGFLTLDGGWRYPAADSPICHATHVLRADPEGQVMYPKWCLDPQGSTKGNAWRTHGIKGLPDQKYEGFGFLHCRLISKNWSYDRSDFPINTLVSDPLAQRVLRWDEEATDGTAWQSRAV